MEVNKMPKKYHGNKQAIKDYKRELQRVKRLVSNLESREYVVPADIIPKTPKTITSASVRNLKKITPDYLYEKSIAYDPETGEILSGKVARGRERRFNAYKGYVTKHKDEIYADDIIESVNPELDIIDDMINWDNEDEIEDDIPIYDERDIDISAIEEVRDRILSMPQIFYTRNGGVDMRSEWEYIINIFDSRVEELEGQDYNVTNDYCNSIINELDAILGDLVRASKEQEVRACYAKILQIVNGMPLSREQAEYAGEITESTDSWSDYE